ncbi:MAG: hypothetical protein DRO12_04450 [Thermoprotei archaeon]|nr:MAG: hypothetical protein DRO12_04450 [Thermoprotei archaeon]
MRLEELLEKLEGFAIYGKDPRDLLERIVRFLGSCEELTVLGRDAGEMIKNLCSRFEVVDTDPSVDVIKSLIKKRRNILFKWHSPVKSVASFVLILNSKRNIELIEKLR